MRPWHACNERLAGSQKAVLCRPCGPKVWRGACNTIEPISLVVLDVRCRDGRAPSLSGPWRLYPQMPCSRSRKCMTRAELMVPHGAPSCASCRSGSSQRMPCLHRAGRLCPTVARLCCAVALAGDGKRRAGSLTLRSYPSRPAPSLGLRGKSRVGCAGAAQGLRKAWVALFCRRRRFAGRGMVRHDPVGLAHGLQSASRWTKRPPRVASYRPLVDPGARTI